MSDLTNKRMDEKWDAFKKVLLKLGVPEKLWLPDELALATAWDELRDAHKEVVVEAYRSALAGETPESLVEAAAKAMWREQWAHSDEPPPENYEAVPIIKTYYEQMARAVSPILRAPLLVQLQDKEARVKALEAALEAHAGCLATDRCPACSAIPEAR